MVTELSRRRTLSSRQSSGPTTITAFRAGFTVLETVLALGILTVVLGITAQASYVALRQRMHTHARQAALEKAGNLLELARATPWQALTPEWAAVQRLPENWEPPDARLEVKVAPEASLARTKRVTVTIRWDFREGIPPQEVQLTALFAARSSREAS